LPKLLHWSWLDAFRLTLPGILLLGRVFSGWDILADWLALALGALADGVIRRRAGRVAATPDRVPKMKLDPRI
jgi:hypothetical protein